MLSILEQESVLFPSPWTICDQGIDEVNGIARSQINTLLLLAFTISTVPALPASAQNGAPAFIYVPGTITAYTATTSNVTLTSETSTQTTSISTATNGTVTSPSGQWDTLIPLLVIGVGAGLAAIVGAVLASRRRRRRVMPTVQFTCPRCRAPVSPYDAACRACHTPLYHPYRFYPRRR